MDKSNDVSLDLFQRAPRSKEVDGGGDGVRGIRILSMQTVSCKSKRYTVHSARDACVSARGCTSAAFLRISPVQMRCAWVSAVNNNRQKQAQQHLTSAGKRLQNQKAVCKIKRPIMLRI